MKVDQNGAANAAKMAQNYMNQQASKEAGSYRGSQGDSSKGTDDVPEEFVQFIKYCRNLKFEEKPDYNMLRRSFKDLFSKKGYEYDYNYDWTPILKKERQSTGSNAKRS